MLKPPRTRVVRVIDRLNIGGPAKHVVWLTAGLDSDEFESTLITGTIPPGEGDMSYFADAIGVEPVIVREMSRELGLRDLLVIAKLTRLFLRLKPEIVHTHKAKAGAAGRIAATIYKWTTPSALLLRPRACKVVHTYHGHIFHSYYGRAKSRLFVAIERALARLCTDRIVVISEQQRREICGTFRVGREAQFRVIPLGIDIQQEDGAASALTLRKEIGASQDDVLVGIVGRLCEVKNHAMFLRAAAKMIETGGRGVRFVVIGDGHLRPELEALSRELGIQDRLAFTGFRKDVLALYAELDVVALTSLNEGTPLTLIEAMSCGLPIAATEVGGVADIMGSRGATVGEVSVWEHGLTSPTQDADAFAKALGYLIERPLERREMGQRGLAFVTNRMSKDRLFGDIADLYRELIGKQEEVASKARTALGAAGE